MSLLGSVLEQQLEDMENEVYEAKEEIKEIFDRLEDKIAKARTQAQKISSGDLKADEVKKLLMQVIGGLTEQDIDEIIEEAL